MGYAKKRFVTIFRYMALIKIYKQIVKIVEIRNFLYVG